MTLTMTTSFSDMKIKCYSQVLKTSKICWLLQSLKETTYMKRPMTLPFETQHDYRLLYKGQLKYVKAGSAFDAQEFGKQHFETDAGSEISIALIRVSGTMVEFSPEL